MTSIRRRGFLPRLLPLTSSGLAAIMMLNGCGTLPADFEDDRADVTESASSIPSLKSLKAEDIYSGIFFGVGPARTLLPEIYGDSAHPRAMRIDKDVLRQKLRETANRLKERGDSEGLVLVKRAMAQLESTDPGSIDLAVPREVADLYVQQIRNQAPNFFHRFETRIRSGNPALVNVALQEAARQTYRASKTLVLSQPEEPGVSAQKEQSVFAAVAVVAAAAVALVAVVWSGVVLVEGVWVVTISNAPGPVDYDSLPYDEFVIRVTKAF